MITPKGPKLRGLTTPPGSMSPKKKGNSSKRKPHLSRYVPSGSGVQSPGKATVRTCGLFLTEGRDPATNLKIFKHLDFKRGYTVDRRISGDSYLLWFSEPLIVVCFICSLLFVVL